MGLRIAKHHLQIEAHDRAAANLAPTMRRLQHPVHSLAPREVARSADNLESIDLGPRHLAVQRPVTRAARPIRIEHVPNRLRLRPRDPIRTPLEVRDSKRSVISVPRKLRMHQKPRLNAGRDNRRVERKKERGLQLRGHRQTAVIRRNLPQAGLATNAASLCSRVSLCRGTQNKGQFFAMKNRRRFTETPYKIITALRSARRSVLRP